MSAVVDGAIESPGDDPGPSAESELGLDVVDVGLDGASGDDQALGDLAVGESLSDEVGDLELPGVNGPART